MNKQDEWGWQKNTFSYRDCRIPVILYMLPTLVHCTVVSVLKSNINLKSLHPGL
jgi:hypothetical protein